MKHNALSLLVLFAATLGFGRTPSPQDTAQAVKGVLRLRDGMHDPDNFQVSRVLITDKGVCIDYRSKNGSGAMSTGFAVYKVNKDTLWVDNSWVWEQACLFGKLAQRRDGMDITEAARAALKGQQAARVQSVIPAVPVATPAAQPPSQVAPVGVPVTNSPGAVAVPQPASAVAPAVAAAPVAAPVSVKAPVTASAPVPGAARPAAPPVAAAIPVQPMTPAVPVANAPGTQPVPPVGIPAAPSQTAATVAQPIPVVPAPVAQPAVAAAPVAAPLPIKTLVTPQKAAPVATHQAAPPDVAPIHVIAVVPASGGTRSTVTPAPSAQRPVATVTVPPVAATPSAQPSSTPATSMEPPAIRGMVILDSQGALGKPTPSLPAPAQESVADVARRLKKAKQQAP
jgi:hypothetical protein